MVTRNNLRALIAIKGQSDRRVREVPSVVLYRFWHLGPTPLIARGGGGWLFEPLPLGADSRVAK
jgi:hypothetical protein